MAVTFACHELVLSTVVFDNCPQKETEYCTGKQLAWI